VCRAWLERRWKDLRKTHRHAPGFNACEFAENFEEQEIHYG
jgi:hypothetical protein